MLKKFEKINEINFSCDYSLENKIYLTFDVDWAHEEIIEYTLEILDLYNVKCTWFVTHKSSVLLDKRNDYEIGIHPNFNKILDQEKLKKPARKVLEEMLNIVPTAKSIRSHSLMQSERLIDMFNEYGLSHTCNQYIPFSSKINLVPYKIWDDIIVVPHAFQDNAFLRSKEKNIIHDIEKSIFCSLNFHPIHIYLNTDKLERYEKARSFYQSPKMLKEFRNHGYGTKTLLEDILSRFTH